MIKLSFRLLFIVVFVPYLTGCTFKPGGPCDSNIAINSADPLDAAKALGICDGLETAKWELPDGTTSTSESFAVGHGILPNFGIANQAWEGVVLLALSSGTARRPSDINYSSPSIGFDKNYAHGYPQASNVEFPISSNACPTPLDAHDGISLSVTFKVPRGVTGYSFDFNYFTADYPDSVCTAYADQAAVILTDKNQASKYILFYGNQNPVSSQTAYYEVCAKPSTGYLCPLGGAGLDKTGFEQNGATGWNTVTESATSGDTVTLKFMIWDSGDGLSDTTILFDNFKWLTQ